MAKKGMHVIPVGDALLKQIRIAETQPGVTRVVLDLEQRAEFTASQLSSPNRLMIELKLKDRPAPPCSDQRYGRRASLDSTRRCVPCGPPSMADASAALDARGLSEPPPERAAASHSPTPAPDLLPQPASSR